MKKTRIAIVALAAIFGIGSAFTTTNRVIQTYAYLPNGTNPPLQYLISEKGDTWECDEIEDPLNTCVYADPELTQRLYTGAFREPAAN